MRRAQRRVSKMVTESLLNRQSLLDSEMPVCSEREHTVLLNRILIRFKSEEVGWSSLLVAEQLAR